LTKLLRHADVTGDLSVFTLPLKSQFLSVHGNVSKTQNSFADRCQYCGWRTVNKL